jgi:beta-aspartyl-dipeptidase (metallo-type)
MGVGQSNVLGETLRDLLRLGHPLEDILPPFTSNVARVLRLSAKGRIAPGMDADFIVLDSTGCFESVMCRGVWAVKDGEILTRGTFEAHRKADS